MSTFNPLLCEKLKSLGLSVTPSTDLITCFAFNGPVALQKQSCLIRCKIDSFSYISFSSVCTTSSIGRYCSIADNVYIGMGEHDISEVSTSLSLCNSNLFDFAGYHVSRLTSAMQRRHGEETNNVSIGNDVWIGSHVLIPSDVTIGHGAVIGAGAVITKDVPPYAVVVGNNRIIKYRFSDEIISDLLELNWWDYNLPKMIQNGALGGGAHLNDPKAFIEFFKNADPSLLVPLKVRWYYIDVKSKSNILDKISLVPVKGPINLYQTLDQ